MSGFASSVGAWAKKTEDRLNKVGKLATQAVANDVRIPVQAGGNMPYLTGNLSRSLEASINAMPQGDISPKLGDRLPDPGAQIANTINLAPAGSVFYLGFRVTYAEAQERRRAFVRLTAQRWQQIVAGVVKNMGAP